MVERDPENIKAVLATHFHDFGKGPEFKNVFSEFLGPTGIFSVDAGPWQHARSILRPQFLREKVSNLDIFDTNVEKLINLIDPSKVTDIMDLFFRFTLDSATEYLFGQSANSLDGNDRDFAANFSRIQEIMVHRLRSGPFWKTGLVHGKEMTRCIAKLDAFVDRYVQAALAKTASEDSDIDPDDSTFLSTLAKASRDPQVIRDQLVSTLFAGRDTTAATLCFTFKELSKRPASWSRLRKEVLSVLGQNGAPTYANLKSMKFIQNVINETLRLYPIVPFNVRTSLVDTTLPRGGGPLGEDPITVPAKTEVSYLTLLMHRHQSLPHAEEWDPTRWETWTPKPWTYIPFNGGPRICLGQNFAQVEIAYVLCRMAQRFTSLENCDGPKQGMGLKYDIILTPREGALVRFD